jgi:hypothetical protein
MDIEVKSSDAGQVASLMAMLIIDNADFFRLKQMLPNVNFTHWKMLPCTGPANSGQSSNQVAGEFYIISNSSVGLAHY